jgi:hypothetical protein
MIDALVEQASKLKSEPYRSPAIKLWKRRAREFVETTYGGDYAETQQSNEMLRPYGREMS